MKPKAYIELFLRLAKQFTKEKGLYLIPRPASIDFMEMYGLSPQDVEIILLALSVSDCFDGPEPDNNPAHARYWTVAEFNPMWHGTRIYFKISINMKTRSCKCLSIKPYRDTWEVHDGTKDL